MIHRLKNILTSKRFYFITGGIISALILIGLLFDYIIMPEYTNFNEGVTVPDVTKVSLEEAEETLGQYGLRHEVLERRSNTAYPANYIIDQDPSALQIVKPDRKVYLTVNTEVQPTAVVPEVVDLSLRNARIQIENYGFTVGTTSYESSRFRNTVLRQSLAPGDTVERGAVINLVVSDGLGERQVPVPDITGISYAEAQQKLRESGFRIGEVRYEPTRDVAPNTVISFSPNAEELTQGETLSLVVSERFDAREESETGAVGADTTSAPPDTSQNDNDQ